MLWHIWGDGTYGHKNGDHRRCLAVPHFPRASLLLSLPQGSRHRAPPGLWGFLQQQDSRNHARMQGFWNALAQQNQRTRLVGCFCPPLFMILLFSSLSNIREESARAGFHGGSPGYCLSRGLREWLRGGVRAESGQAGGRSWGGFSGPWSHLSSCVTTI